MNDYNHLMSNIGQLLEQGRRQAVNVVNDILVRTYWEIGRQIVEFEQKGGERAGYGKTLLATLSKDLTHKYGRGFSTDNLENMRKLYTLFKKSEALPRKLSWYHLCFIMRLDGPLARDFYIIEAENENWSGRELKRQINSMLFERLALSKDKKGVLELSKKGQIIEKPADLVKDPYVLEFLELEESHKYSENELEQKIIENLKKFLLELGKGFMFAARQQRISLNQDNFYIDLVFYNRILRCFVIFEIKIGELTHKDLGQLQMYVNYYDRIIKQKEENPTVGILLCAGKNDAVVEFTLPKENNLFASKYKLYLPDKNTLIKQVRNALKG